MPVDLENLSNGSSNDQSASQTDFNSDNVTEIDEEFEDSLYYDEANNDEGVSDEILEMAVDMNNQMVIFIYFMCDEASTYNFVNQFVAKS